MAEPSLSMSVDDDLPRTVRRERDARERAARERELPGAGTGSTHGPSLRSGPAGFGPQPMAAPQPMRGFEGDDFDLPAPPATVTAFDVPFLRLSMFLIKVVLAGIPALLLLGAILWGAGHALQTFFPRSSSSRS